MRILDIILFCICWFIIGGLIGYMIGENYGFKECKEAVLKVLKEMHEKEEI